MSIFDEPLFLRWPALRALREIAEPTREHLRACLMELARHIADLEKRLSSSSPVEPPAGTGEGVAP